MQRIYYGWVIVAVALVANMLIVGATFSSFGLYVVPVSKDLGISRADMNTALIFTNIGVAVFAPFVGRLLDRLPLRRILIISTVIFGGSLITLGLSHSLWLSAAVMAAPLSAGTLGAGSLVYSVLMARWFVAHRGRAMALSAAGMSLGHVAMAPIVGLLMEGHGWRTVLVTVGCAVTVILLGLAMLVRERPGPDDIETRKPAATPQAAKAQAAALQPAKVGAILAMPQFWLIGLGAALGIGVAQALLVTLAPLASDGGLTPVQAAGLVSAAGVAAILGKLLLAVIADKMDKLILFTGFLVLGVLMNAGLMLSHEYAVLLGCALLLGFTTAALAPLFYALLADRFGAASFGTVRGLMAPLGAIIAAIAIRLAGEVFDRTGGYDLLFAIFIAVQLAAAALMFSTRFTRPAAGSEPAAAPA